MTAQKFSFRGGGVRSGVTSRTAVRTSGRRGVRRRLWPFHALSRQSQALTTPWSFPPPRRCSQPLRLGTGLEVRVATPYGTSCRCMRFFCSFCWCCFEHGCVVSVFPRVQVRGDVFYCLLGLYTRASAWLFSFSCFFFKRRRYPRAGEEGRLACAPRWQGVCSVGVPFLLREMLCSVCCVFPWQGVLVVTRLHESLSPTVFSTRHVPCSVKRQRGVS